MPLYPKINLERKIGSLCFSRLPYAEIISSLPHEIWSFVVCMPHGQVCLKFWEFYDQSWTIDKPPTLCQSWKDRQLTLNIGPSYSQPTHGFVQEVQGKHKLSALHYFLCNICYQIIFFAIIPIDIASLIRSFHRYFALSLSKVRLASLV